MKKTLLFFLLLLCYAVYSPAQKKYNVIFISVDDMDIAFDVFGNPDVRMPNFARLMKHGMLFPQTYCQYPICSPSRTSLLSGKRPDATGVYHNNTNIRSVLGEDYRFLPEYFHDHGYRTERWGKITCTYHSEISYDYIGTINHEPPQHVGQPVPHWWIDTSDKTSAQTRDGLWTDSVIQRMADPVASPYFYGLGLSTHNPFVPILASWNKIGDSSVKELLPVDIDGTYTDVRGNGSGNIILPDAPPDDTADIPPIARTKSFNFSPSEVQSLRHAHYAELKQVDDHLGALLNKLDKSNLWDNTVVVFFSDHGQQLGEHGGLWLKLRLFEESLRVPFVICAPGKKTGVCTRPVELVDLFSTLAELCGLPAPPGQEGSSLVPLLENPDIPWKKAIFAQVERVPVDTALRIMGRSVRTDHFHYNSWSQYGEELYNIKTDPHEYINLAKDAAYEDVLNRMRKLLQNGWEKALPPAYPLRTFFRDKDQDGYGGKGDSIVAYFPPDGYILNRRDCNDNRASIHPDAEENPCNERDDNCNGRIDENKPSATIMSRGNLDICETDSVILLADKGENLNYQWMIDGADIPGATSRRYIARVAGSYKVVISINKSCGSISDAAQVINSCGNILTSDIASTQLTTAPAEEFLLYPNPAGDDIYIIYNSKNTGIAQLRVIDMEGRVLINTTKYALKQNNTYRLNVSHLKPGMYYLELNNSNLQKRIKKFLIGR